MATPDQEVINDIENKAGFTGDAYAEKKKKRVRWQPTTFTTRSFLLNMGEPKSEGL